jgi:hypothetical protein
MNKTPKPTAAERNAKVRAVLEKATEPMTPTDIAAKINEPWCCPYGPTSAPISPVCQRIGAVQPRKGVWELPVQR